jgi:RNAse (barnase) inhibitor barstar
MTPDDYSRLFADTQRAGVAQFNRTELEPLMAAASAVGFLVSRVDLRKTRNKTELLAELGKALRLPEWFGENWDALFDCLVDMGWQPALGYVTLLENGDMLHARAPEDFATLIDIFRQAAQEWQARDVPFWCLVELRDHDSPWPELGT